MTKTDTARIDAEIAALIETDPIAGAKRLIDELARRHQITVRIAPVMPKGTEAYAIPSKRLVVLPPITTSPRTWLALALHEIAHVLEPACPRTGAHVRDDRSGTGACLACEYASWVRAETLLDFDDAMFRAMQDGLRAYLPQTTTTPEMFDTVSRLVRPEALDERRAARLAHQQRRDRQRKVEASILDDKAKAGWFNCSTPGCRSRTSGTITDTTGTPRALCTNCRADAIMADAQARRAALATRTTRTTRTTTPPRMALGTGVISATGRYVEPDDDTAPLLVDPSWGPQVSPGQRVAFHVTVNRQTGVRFAANARDNDEAVRGGGYFFTIARAPNHLVRVPCIPVCKGLRPGAPCLGAGTERNGRLTSAWPKVTGARAALRFVATSPIRCRGIR